MEMKLELVAIPVTDADRARDFYKDKVGFNLNHDHTVNEKLRFVQMTPLGSACSICFGIRIPTIETRLHKGFTNGSKGCSGSS